MINVSVETFLRTGEFGAIRLGDGLDHVLGVLGKPDAHITRRKQKQPSMIEYGVIEFHFSDPAGGLSCIYADDFELLHGGTAINLDPWVLRGGAARADVEKALRSARIGYNRTRPNDESLIGLRTVGGVELMFGDPNDAEWPGLCAMSFEQPAQPEPATKQISVSVSLEIYEMIRSEAQRQRIKTAKLCSRWLTECVKLRDTSRR